MSTIVLNAYLAGIAALAAFGCLLQMTPKTSHAIRFAVILILVAMVGYALGFARAEWATWFDTLIVGGVCAFIIGNRRLPIRRVCPWCEKTSIAVSLLTAVWVGVQWSVT